MLVCRRQPGEQRDDLDATGFKVRKRFRGIGDLAFGGQEHQDVAWAVRTQLVDGGPDGL